ncbi:MAG: cation diffusion facilitator family transporter, partial [Ruminiclostridium sp.]|nr:cation diffusion facilitator family transporter [Ruminiclostridium sp.]
MVKLLARLFIKDSENYTDPNVRTAYGVLTGVVGIVLNFLLFSAKLIAGIVSSSVSVIADAFNNLSDAGSAVISIAGYRIAAMPADKEHPFGHGRAEYIAGLVVSSLIIFMALSIGKESVSNIISPDELAADPLSLCILG